MWWNPWSFRSRSLARIWSLYNMRIQVVNQNGSLNGNSRSSELILFDWAYVAYVNNNSKVYWYMAAKGWITIHVHTYSKQSHNHTIKYESMSLVVGEAIAYKRIFKPISPCKNNWQFVCRSETISDYMSSYLWSIATTIWVYFALFPLKYFSRIVFFFVPYLRLTPSFRLLRRLVSGFFLCYLGHLIEKISLTINRARCRLINQ